MFGVFIFPVREHPAPSGALRHAFMSELIFSTVVVREHPAPSGALRHFERAIPHSRSRQGAPSTIRCIETWSSEYVGWLVNTSGSTQHHQVH